jgi:mannose-6-phosphate isomerase-like protein (cupin superfamily)
MPDPPPRPPYEVTYLSEIPHTPTEASHGFQLVGEWKQIRHHFAMKEFSANAFVATEDGQEITHEHIEPPNEHREFGDEELYYIARGEGVIKLDGEEFDAPEGTLAFVGDPFVVRSITAKTAGTTVLAFGTNPGVEFIVSDFEKTWSRPPRWSDPGKPKPRD